MKTVRCDFRSSMRNTPPARHEKAISVIGISDGSEMRTLNFNHLYYFWVVARTGSVTGASRQLHLTQPTLSTQIKQLERELGAPLFARTGRQMVLPVTGQLVMPHAEKMCRVCEDLPDAIKGRPNKEPMNLVIGTSK